MGSQTFWGRDSKFHLIIRTQHFLPRVLFWNVATWNEMLIRREEDIHWYIFCFVCVFLSLCRVWKYWRAHHGEGPYCCGGGVWHPQRVEPRPRPPQTAQLRLHSQRWSTPGQSFTNTPQQRHWYQGIPVPLQHTSTASSRTHYYFLVSSFCLRYCPRLSPFVYSSVQL